MKGISNRQKMIMKPKEGRRKQQLLLKNTKRRKGTSTHKKPPY